MSRHFRLVLLLGAALPSWALACPSCANRGDGEQLRTVVFLGVMILLPFAVSLLAFLAIRRMLRLEAQPGAERGAP